MFNFLKMLGRGLREVKLHAHDLFNILISFSFYNPVAISCHYDLPFCHFKILNKH